MSQLFSMSRSRSASLGSESSYWQSRSNSRSPTPESSPKNQSKGHDFCDREAAPQCENFKSLEKEVNKRAGVCDLRQTNFNRKHRDLRKELSDIKDVVETQRATIYRLYGEVSILKSRVQRTEQTTWRKDKSLGYERDYTDQDLDQIKSHHYMFEGKVDKLTWRITQMSLRVKPTLRALQLKFKDSPDYFLWNTPECVAITADYVKNKRPDVVKKLIAKRHEYHSSLTWDQYYREVPKFNRGRLNPNTGGYIEVPHPPQNNDAEYEQYDQFVYGRKRKQYSGQCRGVKRGRGRGRGHGFGRGRGRI